MIFQEFVLVWTQPENSGSDAHTLKFNICSTILQLLHYEELFIVTESKTVPHIVIFLAHILSLILAAVFIFVVTWVCPSPILSNIKNDQNEATKYVSETSWNRYFKTLAW